MSLDERLATAGLPPLPRRAWLEIDEDALRNNVSVFRELIGPQAQLMAVVKADAYGHGLVPAARAFVAAGANRLCVAFIDEALPLRAAGIDAEILVLYPVPENHLAAAVERDIQISITDEDSLIALEAAEGDIAAAAFGIETGLSRDGVLTRDLPDVIERSTNVERGSWPHALWSHLATPEDEKATAKQVAAFEHAIELARGAGRSTALTRHIAATGGVLSGFAPVYEGVRIGIGLYGLVPPELQLPPKVQPMADRLRPAMSLKARPIRVQSFPAGTPVGYGGTWVTPRESVIATLPIGYGDGFARAYQPDAEVLVRGRRVPLVGTVAMDAVMADVTNIDGVTTADEFVLLGSQGSESITANDLSRLRNTNPWEVVTSMSFRLPRVYHAGSVLKGLRTLAGEARASGEA